MNIIKKICVIALILSFKGLNAQTVPTQVGIKSNLLYDVLATANLGAEVTVAPRWSIDLSGNLNAWAVDGHKWKHWLVQPEARYWFCRTFSGHFLGVHALGGEYNFGNFDLNLNMLGTDFRVFKDHRREGWFIGAGVAYGYTWILSRKWSMEAEIGVGYVYTRYDQYPCAICGTREAHNQPHNYFGLTKAAVNLIYVF